MNDYNTKELLMYLSQDREEFLKVLDICLKKLKADEKLKLDNALLERIIFKIDRHGIDKGRMITYNTWIQGDLPDTLLSRLDFSNLKYEKLHLDESSLDVIRKTNMVLDFNKLYQMSLCNFDFSGITFTGVLRYSAIYQSSFAGSKGAVIDLNQTDVTGVNFKDATVLNLPGAINADKANFEGCIVMCTDAETNSINELEVKNPTLEKAYYIPKEALIGEKVSNIILEEIESQFGKNKTYYKTLKS